MKAITKTVWILSLVSLFTDTASEMLYPVLPIYLKSIGFSMLLIGILEGIAETTAGLSKGYFGKLSDVSKKRVPFVQLGYSLSAISKPLLAIFNFPIWVFSARTLDRVGKGIRTGARDAILASETSISNKGKVFGFHRSMDTLGAVIGPTFALLFLYFYPEHYKILFYIAFLPGLLAVFSTFQLKEKKIPSTAALSKISFFSFLNYWKGSPAFYKKVVSGLLVFALINSSDVFLLLKAKEIGLNDTHIIGVYIFYNLIYALSAFPLGDLADKIGLKKMIISGFLIFSVVYLGMSLTTNFYAIFSLFLLYGIYAAATEGISKAWISNIVNSEDTATAIGTFTAFQSIAALVASSVAGIIWYLFGAAFLFIVTGLAVLLITGYFIFLKTENSYS